MNKNKKNILSLLSTALLTITLLLFAGCAKNDRKILNNFENRPFDVEREKDNVKVGAKFLTKKEFNTIFKSPNILKRWYVPKNYQVIQVCIDNKNNQNYLFNKNSINLNLLSHNQINKQLKQNAVLIPLLAFPLVTASLSFILFSPTLLTTLIVLSHPHHCNAFILAGLITPIISTIAAGTTCVLWGRSIHKQNKKLRKKIQNQVFDLNEEKIIKHNKIFETIIFTPKKDFDLLSISLLNPKEQKPELKFLLANRSF